jgi:hypothetical protein
MSFPFNEWRNSTADAGGAAWLSLTLIGNLDGRSDCHGGLQQQALSRCNATIALSAFVIFRFLLQFRALVI